MQHNKLQKIVGKKFVRGKPYYKVKWQGSKKDQCTWESPPSLKKFKGIINKYQIKNWGNPLDQKFFDFQLYKTKSFVNKKPQKKTQIKTKKNVRRKVQQSSSSGQSQSQDEKSNEQQQNQTKQEMQEPKPHKKQNKKNIQQKRSIVSQQQLQIIDLDIESVAKLKNIKQVNQQDKDLGKVNQKQIPIIETTRKDMDQSGKKLNQQQNLINIIQIQNQNKQLQNNQLENKKDDEIVYHRNLGLTLQSINVKDRIDNEIKNTDSLNLTQQRDSKTQNIRKNLSMTCAINIEIQPRTKNYQISQIHHLQKLNMDNHMYLIEYKNKEMRKMTTTELLQIHPEQFVSFLQLKFREKCMV